MRRKTFDGLLAGLGGIITVILLIAGGILLMGANYAQNQVATQLSSQKIYFPAANSPEIRALPATDARAMRQYAGELMTTGGQAEVWANNFIAVHLKEMGYTYSQISTLSRAHPTSAKYAGLEQTVFQGTTLRSMLLEAYGFSQLGTIAFDSALAAFALAVVFLMLTGLGFWHRNKVSAAETL